MNNESGYTVTLEDGTHLNFLPCFALEAQELQETGATSEILQLFEIQRCYRKALSFLVRREHSTQQLRIKLMQRQFTNSQIKTSLKMLIEEGSLSDLRFATEWVDARLSGHPEGSGKLMAGLQQRGVKRQIAEQALRLLQDNDPECFSRACLSYALKLYRNSVPINEIVASCKKRGFSNKNLADCSGEFYSCTRVSLTGASLA